MYLRRIEFRWQTGQTRNQIGAILAPMYRFHRQFDYRSRGRQAGRLSMNLVILLAAIGAFDLGVSLLSWLMHIRRATSNGYFLELCLVVSIVASLMLILAPAFHLNAVLRRLKAGS